MDEKKQEEERAKAVIDWINAQMAEREWGVRQLARKSGVSRSLLSGLLLGKYPATAPTLIKLAETFGVSNAVPLRIAGMVEQVDVEDALRQKILQDLEDMEPEDQEEIAAYVKMKRERSQSKKNNQIEVVLSR